MIEGREIDSVTDEALIQAKDSETARNNPHNFINKKICSQIKETIRIAKSLDKQAEFWFKQDPPKSEIRNYIEHKDHIVFGSKKP
ncbi:MAG: hypothetical protein BRC36_14545 [Cyanobacteria bacterium QH_2_48_84]|nr:MAG: hypothetical protein BRC36_14545 [Cyanobacteria bacterium QH_2_48_84]